MNKPFLSRVSAMLISTAVIFGIWAAVRLVLIDVWRRALDNSSLPPERLLSYISDVEIHSLQFRARFDLLIIPFAALLLRITARKLAGSVFSLVMATIVAGSLAIAMIYYPALTLSGRMTSRFTGVHRGVFEAITFAVSTVALLVTLARGVSLLRRAERSTRREASRGGG